MTLLTTIAAAVMMNPGQVATDVPAPQFETPAYNWKCQKITDCQKQSQILPNTGLSISGTQSQIEGAFTIDDWNTWD